MTSGVGATAWTASGRSDLRARLKRYLEDDRPLASCSFCLGTSGPLEEHHLLNKKGVEAWWEEDHRGLIEGLRSRLLPGEATVAHASSSSSPLTSPLVRFA